MTTARQELPLSGYTVLKIYSSHQELRHEEPDESIPGSVKVGWDWQKLDKDIFEVLLGVTLYPSAERDDYASINVVGQFRQVGESPSVSLAEFARLQAVAILLPYARQFLSNLTANSFYGAYYLPTVNVVELMRDFDQEKTTGGMQLAAGTDQVSKPSSASRRSKSRITSDTK